MQFLALKDSPVGQTNQDWSQYPIGILAKTTNAQFVQTAYPQSSLVVFAGETASRDALQSLDQGSITTFASDSVLLLGELLRQNRFKQAKSDSRPDPEP